MIKFKMLTSALVFSSLLSVSGAFAMDGNDDYDKTCPPPCRAVSTQACPPPCQPVVGDQETIKGKSFQGFFLGGNILIDPMKRK